LPSEINPSFLYLGSYDNASKKDQLNCIGITHILNVADELENKFPGEYVYKRCGVNDTPMDSISHYFDDAINFINDARKDPKNRVLVHCAMGISRSSAITIAWLMKENKWNYETARNFVKSKRYSISPNSGFVNQLNQFEKMIIQ